MMIPLGRENMKDGLTLMQRLDRDVEEELI